MKKLMLIALIVTPIGMNAGVAKLAVKGAAHTAKFSVKAVKKTAKVAYKVAI